MRWGEMERASGSPSGEVQERSAVARKRERDTTLSELQDEDLGKERVIGDADSTSCTEWLAALCRLVQVFARIVVHALAASKRTCNLGVR